MARKKQIEIVEKIINEDEEISVTDDVEQIIKEEIFDEQPSEIRNEIAEPKKVISKKKPRTEKQKQATERMLKARAEKLEKTRLEKELEKLNKSEETRRQEVYLTKKKKRENILKIDDIQAKIDKLEEMLTQLQQKKKLPEPTLQQNFQEDTFEMPTRLRKKNNYF